MLTPTPNQPAPLLEFDTVDGRRWSLSRAKAENFSMIVFYRGMHCPLCREYLRGLTSLLPEFRRRGVEVVAVSMDNKRRARQTHEWWELGDLPLGFGLPEVVAKGWGLYISEGIKTGEADRFSEPGLFLVRPDHRIHYVSITNMPFGRPPLDEVLAGIDFILEQSYPARGWAA